MVQKINAAQGEGGLHNNPLAIYWADTWHPLDPHDTSVAMELHPFFGGRMSFPAELTIHKKTGSFYLFIYIPRDPITF